METDALLAAVGPRLRAARLRSGLTLQALSRRTGVSTSILSRLESGKRQPTLELLLPLARIHGVPLDDLVGAPAIGDPGIHLRPYRAHGTTVIPLVLQPERVLPFKQIIMANDVASEPASHPGHQWLCVIAGRLRLLLDGVASVLAVGEIIEFDTRIPHLLEPADGRRVELLCLYGPDGQRPRPHL